MLLNLSKGSSAEVTPLDTIDSITLSAQMKHRHDFLSCRACPRTPIVTKDTGPYLPSLSIYFAKACSPQCLYFRALLQFDVDR